MIVFSAFLLYMGWALIDSVEPWSPAYWGRIIIVVSITVMLNRLIEAIEESNN